MKKPWKIIQELESDNSRLFKEKIIKRENDAKNEIFFSGCQLAMDKLRTFGLKKVPISKKMAEELLGKNLPI